jgi:hypothetical protein
MKKALVILLGISLLALFIGSVSARDVNNAGRARMKMWSDNEFELPEDPNNPAPLMATAQVDTYCIVWYDFEQMNWQGWERVDNTAQVDTFTHVDNFSGIAPGDYGLLVPIEGLQSMWCGARPDPGDPYMCSWITPPGYGNAWSQTLMSDELFFTGSITWCYHGVFDSEPDWDQTFVEYDAGSGNWIELAMYDGTIDTVACHVITIAQLSTKLRYHFVADGAWSDADGLWNTDGAFIVDSIIVQDEDLINDYEDFEGAPFMAKSAGIWTAGVEEPYGRFSGLWNNLGDKDPCGDNFASQVVFFVGSGEPSGLYPGLYDTPFCLGGGGTEAPCQDEAIVSPIIDMTQYSSQCDENQDASIPPGDLPELGGALLRFTCYRDIPVLNCVFYIWSVRNWIAGCPSAWEDRNYVYYGPDMDYIYTTQDISDLVGANPIQMRLGCVDMCLHWFEVYCTCAGHTPSPWMDNARIYRYKTTGPQWSSRDLDLFQDKFPESLDIESHCRADAANDVRPNDDPVIDPGDSITVDCTSLLGGGIAEDVLGPRVYMHVKCEYIGPLVPPWGPKPQYIFGPSLQGTYGIYVGDDGVMWTVIQADTARTGSAHNPVYDKYMWDMNDSLITRGYMCSYYFEAFDNAGAASTHPQYARTRANRTYGNPPYKQVSYIFEWTCLPTGLSDALYIDDFHGRGTFWGNVEQYWNPSFLAVFPETNRPDRYDVNNPSSLISNGPGHIAQLSHLAVYYKMFWDSGNLESGTITEGTVYSDKSNDCAFLVNWMNLSEHECGLWICGDDIAQDLSDPAAAPIALALMSTWCGVTLNADPNAGSYFELTGGRTAGGIAVPEIVGAPPPSIFGAPPQPAPDTFYADGGCFVINQFDVLEKTANGQYALEYPDYLGDKYYYGIQAIDTNAAEFIVKTMWFGSSFQYVRDKVAASPPIRNLLLKKVVDWFGNITNEDITDVEETPKAFSLAQNFPNPFNPTTTIKFNMREKGHVTIKIYNVAGQLVRTLVNEVRDVGPQSIDWKGRNDLGKSVASGVYFYKMDTKNFVQTRKMVLLR